MSKTRLPVSVEYPSTTALKVAFVTNICAHHRVQTFEILARHYQVDYHFFSAGDEWYWQRQHGVRAGDFRYEYLPGFRVGATRFTPSLPIKLWRGRYDLYIKCINGRFALPITYLVARLRRKPFILWTGVWMRLQSFAHRLFFPLTRYIYRHADAIVVYGEHVKRYLISEGVPPERIFVTTHAVDNSAYNYKVSEETQVALLHNLDIDCDKKVVLYLGRLEEGKGLPILIDAFASLQQEDAILVLAGTGSAREHLEQLVNERGIGERVRFTGYVQPEDTVSYYAIAWTYVLPSLTTGNFKEPWGLVVNEAFNQGVPVIATDAVGAAAGGLVQDAVTGFVVPERDAEALAEAIQRILNDEPLRNMLSENARRMIADWDNERMVLGFRQAVDYVMQVRGER